jgi:dipeptidase D
MTSPLEKLEPRLVWQHFDALRQIPRPSKHEEAAAEHVLAWAAARGFETQRDAVGNTVVRVPASPGREQAPVVVLQGHLDMVPEKNSDVAFDFLKDPIAVRIDGDFVYATGTTLGADNGVGVAAAMAAAEDPAAVHGPLELLLTVDEETGLTGAQGLDATMLKGRILLNLDTEEDATVYIGCAGGSDTNARFTVTRQAAATGSAPLRLTARGLRGGHSGTEIHENRGNAIKLVARVLDAARTAGLLFEIVAMTGGNKRNAIAREAEAVLRVPADQEGAFRALVTERVAALAEEYGEIEPNLAITLTAAGDDDASRQVWSAADRDRVLDALVACPHGVQAMSRAVAGLVETSTNLGVVITDGNDVRVTCLTRSSVTLSLRATTAQLAALFRLAGAESSATPGYPGWKPNPASPLLATIIRVCERTLGRKPEVKAVHAGLECGLIGGRVPGMDMASLGPQIDSPHSPDERVKISTVASFYALLKAVLAELA